MKTIFFSILCITFLFADGQNNSELESNYFWKREVVMEAVNLNGTKTGEVVISLVGQKFRVISEKEEGDKVLIRILNYKKVDDPGSNFYKYNYGTKDLAKASLMDSAKALSAQDFKTGTFGDYQKYFLVDKSNILKHATPYSVIDHSLALGFLNLPFKARIQKGKEDFSGTFNFGSAVGYKFKHYSYSPWAHNVVLGLSFSNVSLDSVSVSKNHEDLSETNEFTALSLSVGYMLEYKNVQVGIFLGWDHIDRKVQSNYDWDYQGKPWISLALGYSIFSKEEQKKDVSNIQ